MKLTLFKGITVFCMVLLVIAGCKKSSPTRPGSPSPAPESSHISLTIVSGSENKSLEPIIQQFARDNKASIGIEYMGSVDISRQIAQGTAAQYDVVWPAASLWIALGDTQSVVKHAKSIMRSPVVFAIKKSLAQKLNWIGKDVSVDEILAATESGQIRFAMTSATQSNSGASAYLGYLAAFAGKPDILTSEHLKNEQVQSKIRRFLHSVERSSGSSGWLMEMVLENYDQYDAMVNYETLVIEANQKLAKLGKEPLYVIYPVDGLMIADSPLGYINKGNAEKEAFFQKLQDYLLSDSVQAQIQRLGRRTGLVGMNPGQIDASVFNPDWGIDISRILSPIPTPSGPVVQEALMLYQTLLRKPSLTAFVLDFSGSMRNIGEKQVKQAMRTLLDQKLAEQYLLQSSPEDVTVVIPFNDAIIATWKVEGGAPDKLNGLMMNIERQGAGGGTDMYTASMEAIRQLQEYDRSGKYHSSIIVMSDGMSQGSYDEFNDQIDSRKLSRDIPIYTILFGQASEQQMQMLAKKFNGRMFDGRQDVVSAFREAKGYN